MVVGFAIEGLQDCAAFTKLRAFAKTRGLSLFYGGGDAANAEDGHLVTLYPWLVGTEIIEVRGGYEQASGFEYEPGTDSWQRRSRSPAVRGRRTGEARREHRIGSLPSLKKQNKRPKRTEASELLRSWSMKLTVELEQEEDGRCIAEVLELPGVMVYGDTHEQALSKVQVLALRVLADRLEGVEFPETPLTVSFEMASAA